MTTPLTTKYCVGIDLGTSNCAIGFYAANKVRLLKDAEGDPLIPSAVFFAPDGTTLVGKDALKAARDSEEPDRLMVETKRLMGEPAQRWRYGGVEYSPVDIAAILLRHLRLSFEARVGQIERAVICVPAMYDPARRQLVRESARQAGLPMADLVLMDEPVAAALPQILGDEPLSYLVLADEQVLLVYDLGGGSFDLSMVHYSNNHFRVVAKDSKIDLGGVDWTRRLEQHVLDMIEFEHGIDLNEPRHRRPRYTLKLWAEQAKRSFSDPLTAAAEFTVPVGRKTLRVEVARKKFEEMTADLADETRKLTEALIRKSKLYNQISAILGVGGSTHMPPIKKVLNGAAYFAGQLGFITHRNSPQYSVVEGAAIFSRILKRQSPPAATAGVSSQTDGTVMEFTPVTGRGLGVVVERNGQPINRILIPRNSPLPARNTRTVYPGHSHMRKFNVVVVDGDVEDLGQCTIIGECRLEEFPEEVRKDSAFEVELRLDVSNLLEIEFRHVETGRVAKSSLLWSGGSRKKKLRR